MLSITNGNDGSYAVTISKADTYYLVASGTDPLIVPAVCQVVVTSPSSADPQTITVYISVKDPRGQTYLSKTRYAVEPGTTVYDLLCMIDLDITAGNSENGVYVEAIDGLAEFDAGSGRRYHQGYQRHRFQP